MLIGGGNRKVEALIKKECGLSPLLMYNPNQKPDGRIEFDEFASLALERFSILQMVENVGTRYMKHGNDYVKHLENEFRKIAFLKTILLNSKETGVDETELNKDILSHFILRLAFCQSEESKRWFIQNEVDLFKFKFNRVANEPYIIEKFLKDNELFYSPITDEEKKGIIDNLVEMGVSHQQALNQNYYKVNYLEVLELVKSRRVLVKKGFAYVTIFDFSSVLTHVFRSRLSKSLSMLSRHLKEVEEDQRIADLFKILRERDVAENYADAQSKENLTMESLDGHAIKSFPICMRHLHDSLKQNHHLRHYGRLQYGLFLKGIGLPMEESLRFFKNEFSKGTIPLDKFDKEYAYNIRHSYGKEGKRTSYTPYSCLKIITSHMPGNNDYHGCPYKHLERDFLKQKLRQYGRNDDEIGQIMEHSDSNNYQIACQRYFEFSHKTEELVPINHPNQYFEQSMRILSTHSSGNSGTQGSPYGYRRNIKMEHIKVEMTQ